MSTKTTITSKIVKNKAQKAKTVEPAAAPVPTLAATVEEPTATVTEDTTTTTTSMRQRFETLIKSKQELISSIKQEVQELRKMQRDHETALKDAMKNKKRKQRDDATPRKPSGFASPVVVSDDLYSFLERYGVSSGQPIARTDVTRHITAYIKEHDLQNPEHRREIVPDATLKKLFGDAQELKDPENPKSPMVYTYLKLQRYLSQHFPKKQTA